MRRHVNRVVARGVGVAAVLKISMLAYAQQPAHHLPVVGEYGAVLAYSIVLDGDYACVGTTTGVEILKVANPAKIEKLSSIDAFSNSRCIGVGGRHAYVASSSDGFVILDVSNRSSPAIVGRYRGRTRYSDGQVQGRYAYTVLSTGGLDVIDIADPARPTLAGTVSFTGADGRVRLRGQTAYVSLGGGDSGGVRIVDVSQPTTPRVVGEVGIEGLGGLIALVNGHLAVATARGVCLYDLSSPRAPVLRKRLPGRLSDICSDGDRTLFVHSRGLTTVFNLSSVESPRVLGTIGAYFHDLARRDDLVFGVMTGMKVYGLGQPAAPSR
jgi:hypothetical protein